MTCASVTTYSPVIMAKTKPRVSNCAEEESPPCSTLLPRPESVEEKKPLLAPSVPPSITTAEPFMETTIHQTQMCVALSVLNEFIFSHLIGSNTILCIALML